MPACVRVTPWSSADECTVAQAGKESGARGVVVPTARGAQAPLELEELAARQTDELCAVDLDRPALDSLARLHALWGVTSEREALEHVLSFAACAALSPYTRAKALGITNTAERLQHARNALRRASKMAAARLAVRRALA